VAKPVASNIPPGTHISYARLRRENTLLEASWQAGVEAVEVARRQAYESQTRADRLSGERDTAVADAAVLAQMLQAAITISPELHMTPAIAALVSRCQLANPPNTKTEADAVGARPSAVVPSSGGGG